MTQWILQELGKVQAVVMAGIVAAAGGLIAHAWIKHRHIGRVIAAMILAGVVVWGAGNVQWFRDKVGQETGMIAPASVIHHTSGPAT